MILHNTETRIIKRAPKFKLITLKLLKIDLISNFSAYKINVPRTIIKIPKYSIFLSVSFNIRYEKKELNIGVNDKSGIVKLKSERTKDLKNIIAEITLIKTKIKPGTKYGFSILKLS